MKEAHENLLQVLTNQSLPVRDRIDAARSLGLSQDPAVAKPLQEFLRRERPPDEDYIDYDPRVNERLCDIAVVGALHELGDDSLWSFLLDAVAQAGSGLEQRIRETDLAADVVLKIGSTTLVGQVVTLCEGDQEPVLASAVRTLAAMDLPGPATHQPVRDLPGLMEPMDVTPDMLAEYFNDIVSRSDGVLILTDQVRASLAANDYPIAEGETEQVTLYEVLTEDLRIYNLAYFVQDDKAHICSFGEAARRWQGWWQTYGERLAFDQQQSRFILIGEEKP